MKLKLHKHLALPVALTTMAALALPAFAQLPDPDGKPADMSKPVQVFVIMGQSNTLEMGKVGPADKDGTLEHAVKAEKLYPFLVDDAGNWNTRMDVRNVSVMEKNGNMGVYRNDWLTVTNKMGMEIGIGYELGQAIDAPVMVLKSSIGNRSLGWDLLPPGSKRYEFDLTDRKGETKTYIFAGYKDSPDKWEKGIEKPKGIAWYAGKQYDDDVGNAKKILSDLDKYYPGAKSYEVAGFLWWQGDKDMRNPAHVAMYEKNLVQLIKSLRKDFNAPKAAFVTASLGQTEEGSKKGDGLILDAMKSVASGKYADELGKNIGFVYTHPLLGGPGSSSGHYSHNAKTYMNVGLAMGKAMADLLKHQN